MNIPDQIKLNGVTYDVVWKDDIFHEDGQRLDGRINFYQNTIELNKSTQSYQTACRTLLHELVHFALKEHTLSDGDFVIPENEEELCELMARSFYQILEDNKLY